MLPILTDEVVPPLEPRVGHVAEELIVLQMRGDHGARPGQVRSHAGELIHGDREPFWSTSTFGYQ